MIKHKASEKTQKVYILKVALSDSKKVWRKIAILGSQTLHKLHLAIFSAFERHEEHLYAFYLPNKINSEWRKTFRAIGIRTLGGAMQTKIEYGIPDPDFPSGVKSAKSAKIEKLDLAIKDKFEYLFDFGDCLEHIITVVDIIDIKDTTELNEKKYPIYFESQDLVPRPSKD